MSQRSAGGGSPWIPHRAEQVPACAESGSCTARTRYPTACLGRLGSSAQDAFHRIDARHCCRAGLVNAHCSGSRSFTQHPCRPKRSGSTVTRSGRSVLPDAVDVALAGSAGDAEKMPLTDFCNRPTARAPTEPLDSLAFTRLATSLATVEGSVDAVPPASAVRSTLSRDGAAKADSASGEEFRTGPALPCDGVFLPLGGLDARPLTLPVTTWFDLLESARPRQPGPFLPRLRQETRFSRSRAPSIDRCPLATCLRRCRGARHHTRGVAACEPASGDPLGLLLNLRQVPACAASLRLSGKRLHHLGPEAHRPGRSAEWIHRLSTSAIATVLEHDSGRDHHPASFAEGYPSAPR